MPTSETSEWRDGAPTPSDRITHEELAALTPPSSATSRKEKLETVARATRGLRVDVRVTPSLYGRK